MNQEKIIEQLRSPFSAKDVEWKIQVTTQDKARGMAVAYLDARAIQKRLDETLGAFNWKNVYSLWHDKAQICGISIFNEARNEWVTKFDGAENSEIEPIKGGLSDSFKRAASVWGIGRYLYDLDSVWVEIEPKGKSFAIKQNQYSKIDAEYNAAVKRMFGNAANAQAIQGNTNTNGNGNRNNNGSSSGSSSNGGSINIGSNGSGTIHSNDVPNAPSIPANSSIKQSSSKPEPVSQGSDPSGNIVFDFRVQSIKPSGKSSQVLELEGNDGTITKAYIKAIDQSITTGSHLKNVTLERKNSEYGEYNLINAYQIAA